MTSRLFHAIGLLVTMRRVLLSIATLLLWLTLLIFPHPPDTYLDASWQLTLVYAHGQNWQFGREIIFTWGPWGYLFSLFHLGDTAAGSRLIWELGGKLLLAGGLVVAMSRFGPYRQAALMGAAILGLHYFQDCAYLLFISAISLTLIRSVRNQLGWLIGTMVIFAFLAQVKFTYTLLVVVGTCLATIVRIHERNWREAVVIPGSLILFFLGWWAAARQNPDNIWPYFKRSWEISTGYAGAMSIEESMPVFLCGLATLILVGAFLLLRMRRASSDMRTAAGAMYAAAAVFLAWKHGFTRADGHVLGFFLFLLPFSLLLAGSFPSPRRWQWLDLAVLPCLAGIWFFEAGLPMQLPETTLNRIRVNAAGVIQAPRLPAAWEAAFISAQQQHALPRIAAKVDRSKVDVFNFEQGYALLNKLNLTPRPIFQGYSTYTPGLAARNLRFYQSPDAPRFLLWRHDSIDGRFPTLDDAPLYPFLLNVYRPVLEENGFLLLQRKPGEAQRPPQRQLVFQRGTNLGETVTLPTMANQALWIKLHLHPTKIGRIRSFLYKPYPLQMTVVEASGRSTSWRLIPAIAADGFLIHPFIEIQTDFAAFLEGQSAKEIRTVRIDAPDGNEFWKSAEILVYTLSGITLDDTRTLRDFVDRGLSNVAPVRIEATTPLEYFAVAGVPAVQCHAPASLTFAPPAGSSRISAGFGLRSGAYTGDGRSDGVEFRIVAHRQGQPPTVLWQRLLQPSQQPADRGTHWVELEITAADELTLETASGPSDNESWDWSYWTDIRFQ